MPTNAQQASVRARMSRGMALARVRDPASASELASRTFGDARERDLSTMASDRRDQRRSERAKRNGVRTPHKLHLDAGLRELSQRL